MAGDDLFPPAGIFDIRLEDKTAAIDRELKLRRRVFARRVADGKMTQDFADRQILIFEAIADDYRRECIRP